MNLVETEDGTIVEIYVRLNQPRFKVTLNGEEIVISSTEEPVKGRVNKEIIKELTKIFHFKVELISGSTSREKKLIVKGLRKTEAERILRKSHSDASRQQ